MRFGISATSRIFPKNLRTRLRPVNVCAAILSLSLRRTVGSGTTLRKAAIHRDRQDRRRALYVSMRFDPAAGPLLRSANRRIYGDFEDFLPKSPPCVPFRLSYRL